MERCQNYRACSTRVPKPDSEDSIVKFKNYKALLKAPFVIYADYECLTREIQDQDYNLATRAYQRHEPFSCAYYVVCSFNDSLSHFRTYCGPNPDVWMVNQFRQESLEIKTALDACSKVAMLPLTPDQSLKHLAVRCVPRRLQTTTPKCTIMTI